MFSIGIESVSIAHPQAVRSLFLSTFVGGEVLQISQDEALSFSAANYGIAASGKLIMVNNAEMRLKFRRDLPNLQLVYDL